MRDLRLTSSLIDLLGLDILGINNLFIWKAPEIGLGFPWHQDKYYFRRRFRTETTVGTWTVWTLPIRKTAVSMSSPVATKAITKVISSNTMTSKVRNRRSSSWHEGFATKMAYRWRSSPVPLSGSIAINPQKYNNHSQRFRRSYVAHYLSTKAEWSFPDQAGRGQPVMWIGSRTLPGKAHEIERDVLLIL